MCLLTNERYKTYLTGFSFGSLGHAPGVRLGGTMGGVGLGGQKNNSEIQPEMVCELLDEWHMQQHNLWGPRPPGALRRGQKVKYH